MILIGWLTIVNTNVTVYLLLRIVNLTPADRSIETDLAATGSFISALVRFQTAAACCTHATRNKLTGPSDNPVHMLLSGPRE